MVDRARAAIFLRGLALLCLAAPLAAAADPLAVCPPAAGAEQEPGRIDRYHDNLSDRVDRYVHNLDCLLAGQRVPETDTGSWIRVIPRVQVEDGKGFSVGASFKSKIILPHLKDRLELIADNMPANVLPGREIDPEDYKNVNAGLRYKVLHRGLAMVNLDGGVNLNPYPSPFARLTLSHAFHLQDWVMELRQDGFFYYNDDGFGEMSQLEFTRVLASGSLFRATSAATWSEETVGLEWEQSFLLWHELERARRNINLQVSFFGHFDSAYAMDNYQISSTYRWTAFRPWLFFALTQQLSFPEDRDFRPTPMVRLAMEITCGDY